MPPLPPGSTAAAAAAVAAVAAAEGGSLPPTSPLRSLKASPYSAERFLRPLSSSSAALRTPGSSSASAASSTLSVGYTPLSAERKRRQQERELANLHEAQRFLGETVGSSLVGLDEEAFLDELVDGVVLCDYVNKIMVSAGTTDD